MSYVQGIRRPPKVLTEGEQLRILKATGKNRADFRDHMIIAFALGTALRESELAALVVADVFDGQRVKRRIKLREYKHASRKESQQAHQEVFLPDGLLLKVRRFIKWKAKKGEQVGAGSPFFAGRGGGHLSTRMLRHLFAAWQRRAGLDQVQPFHCLRHTSITNLYRATKDIRVAQRHGRHANIGTTQIYTHVSDEELSAAVRGLRC